MIINNLTKKIVIYFSIFLISLTLTFLVFLTMLYPEITMSPDDYYLYKSNEFKFDDEVNRIVDICQNDYTDYGNQILCVYHNTPMNYDYNRADSNDIFNVILSPSQIRERNYYSVCRDIAVFRKSIFLRLGIRSEFVLLPNHIYVRAFNLNSTYELDNQYLRNY